MPTFIQGLLTSRKCLRQHDVEYVYCIMQSGDPGKKLGRWSCLYVAREVMASAWYLGPIGLVTRATYA